MAKQAAKKKFSFKNMFNPKPQTVSEGYAQLAGAQITSKGNYKSPKTGLNQAKDDVLMDLGVKEKDQDYYARLDDRKKRSQEASKNLGKDIFGRPASDRSAAARGETAAERAARLKKEALEKRKTEGKERRKKFYKQKDERLAKLKAKLLNLA